MHRRRLVMLSISLWASVVALLSLVRLLNSTPVEAVSCDVPSSSHANIQSAVDDPSCTSINLIGALYEESVFINRSVTVSGQGPATTVVDGGGWNSVFCIRELVAVTLTDMTITRGRNTDYYGGGIDAGGDSELTLMNIVVQGNWSDSGGGGLYAAGPAVIINTLFINNYCLDYMCWGGAVFNERGLTIKNSAFISNSAGSGAAINNDNRLTITNSTFFSNTARMSGGAIRNYVGSYADITDSWFAENQAENGGAISTVPGVEVYIDRSTLNDNSATDRGGAISNYGLLGSPGIVEIVNSTLSGNSAGNEGGAIFSHENSTIFVLNSTLTGNSAAVGGGIHSLTATINITNSIVANSLSGGDCGGTMLTSHGNNIDNDGSCGFNESSDLPNTNPLLGPLKNNGGQTPTHALFPVSPAIDAGNNNACPSVDQRGISRPLDGDGDLDPVCDIGAFELAVLYDEHIFLPSLIKDGS